MEYIYQEPVCLVIEVLKADEAKDRIRDYGEAMEERRTDEGVRKEDH